MRAVLLLMLWACSGVFAADYPTKPIRMLMPYPPGGAIDILGRILAQPLAESLGQNVVPDNRGGANGIVASELAAKSPPDGYTIYFASVGQISINPSAYRKLPYDAFRDFAPVILHSDIPSLLLVHPSLPVRNVSEFIAFVKTRPEGMSYATPGAASTNHLTSELFARMTGIRLTHIPYKGSGPAQLDVMSGQVPMMFDQITSSLGHVKAGKMKALAVSTAKRSALLPELPTVIESGLPGFDTSSWNGVLVPAGTPATVIARLNKLIGEFHTRPAFREKMLAVGAEPIGGTPQQFTTHAKAELARWSRVLQDTNTHLD